MTDSPIINSAFARAVELLGGQAPTGRFVGKHQTTVRERLLKGQPLWAEHVLAVEAATGVSRHDLRPDIYPRDLVPAPHEYQSSGARPDAAPSAGSSAADGVPSSAADLAA